MKKPVAIILAILLILVISIYAGIIYLNNIYLPKTIKALIVRGIEDKTNSRVTLESLRVNIFKGLVLRDLRIYDKETLLISVKEASCLILPVPVLQKKIIIPGINLKSPQIFLERKKDGIFNLQGLAPVSRPSDNTVKAPSKQQTAKAPKGFNVFIARINISNAKIIFQDNSLDKPFNAVADNLNLNISLSLPGIIRFKLSGRMPGGPGLNLSASGDFKVPTGELNAKITVQNISPKEFSAYYINTGLNIPEGLINLSADLKTKDGLLYSEITGQAKNINALQGKISVKSDITLNAVLTYNLKDKDFKYSGSAEVTGASVSGLEFVEKINSINSRVSFNNAEISAEKLTADIFGLPVKARVSLSSVGEPVLSINASSALSLSLLQQILKDKFKFNFPGKMDGQGNLVLNAEGKLSQPDNLALSGYLELVNSALKLEKIDYPVREINGKIAFTRDKQSGLSLLDIALKSTDISLASNLVVNSKRIEISKCSGNYLSSQFSITGSVNTENPSRPLVDLNGTLFFDLKDLNKPLNKFKAQLAQINPKGKIKADLSLAGDINDFKSCALSARLSGSSIGAYGLEGKDLLVNCSQKDGIFDITGAHLSLYSGAFDAYFTANLNSPNSPYWFNANIVGVKIEELKKDTPAKDKNLAGIIQAEVKTSGFLNDIPNSKGTGKIIITEGKLWELDLFKGLGKVLFSQDFANITFNEGSCYFVIQDKYIATDKLELKSNMVNLTGPVKIGFDSSINARLNVDIVSELVPVTGTFKDVTTSLMSQSGRFAEIKISGTLKEPKYKFGTAVTDILKGLAGSFLKGL